MTSADTIVLEKEEKTRESIPEPKYICFVCSGNTCRSPMAAAIFNSLEKKYIEKHPDKTRYFALSAGIFTAGGESISENAVLALESAGIESTPDNDYKRHLSRKLDAGIMENCEKIVGITGAHAMDIMFVYPAYASKVCCFASDVSDPYGGDLERYIRCFDELKKNIEEAFFPEES